MKVENQSTLEIKRIEGTGKYEILTLDSVSEDEHLHVEIWDVEVLPKD